MAPTTCQLCGESDTRCKTCTEPDCGLRYCQHHPCEVCGFALEHRRVHPDGRTTDEEWDGRARMATAKAEAGDPLNDVELKALRRCPNPTFLCGNCMSYQPRGHECAPLPARCGRCGVELDRPALPCPACTPALRARTVESSKAKIAAVSEAVAAGWRWDPTIGRWGDWKCWDPTIEPAESDGEPGGWVLWGGGRA